MGLKYYHVLTASKPRQGYGLSPSAPALLTLGLQLSEPWVPTSLPQHPQAEGEGSEFAVSGPAVWHGPAGRSGSLPLLSFHIISINTPFSPCQVPSPHPRPQPTPRMGPFSSNKGFLFRLDGYLGTAAPIAHGMEPQPSFFSCKHGV